MLILTSGGQCNVQGEFPVHSAEGVTQNVGSEFASALNAAATDTEVRPVGIGLILFFLDQRTNNDSERNIPGLFNLIRLLLPQPFHH